MADRAGGVVREGLDLLSRPIIAQEAGRPAAALGIPVLAVVRAGRTMLYSDPGAGALEAGDEIVYVRA